MPVPAWPDVPFASLKAGFSNDPFLPPIKTEMEGGNVRVRSRPGDNVAVIKQQVLMSKANYVTLKAWGASMLGSWTGRFTMPVWLGGETYETKVCQFQEGAPKPTEYSPTDVSVVMTLRVYDV